MYLDVISSTPLSTDRDSSNSVVRTSLSKQHRACTRAHMLARAGEGKCDDCQLAQWERPLLIGEDIFEKEKCHSDTKSKPCRQIPYPIRMTCIIRMGADDSNNFYLSSEDTKASTVAGRSLTANWVVRARSHQKTKKKKEEEEEAKGKEVGY